MVEKDTFISVKERVSTTNSRSDDGAFSGPQSVFQVWPVSISRAKMEEEQGPGPGEKSSYPLCQQPCFQHCLPKAGQPNSGGGHLLLAQKAFGLHF